MTTTRALLAAAAATLLLLTGCSGDGEETTTTDGSGAAATEHNDADVRFAQDMIPHHQQALEMAEMAESAAASADVRELAAAIAAAQGPEIETMTSWLEDWGEEVPSGTNHADMGHGGMDEMPGMMDAEQMGALSGAMGADFDSMWLEMMIEHHEGAVEMAKVQQEDGRYAEAVALAERIEADQLAEIEVMRALLG
ncbi:MAG TPA: DUF305 domain-containing protein [Jiangellales bacterium]|nr:DUF305 domain-containing protein [Jiangellales bacterium]